MKAGGCPLEMRMGAWQREQPVTGFGAFLEKLTVPVDGKSLEEDGGLMLHSEDGCGAVPYGWPWQTGKREKT